MCKQEFLTQLRKGLTGLPQEDIEERIIFFSEMIEDQIEEGLSEEEAVAAIGPVEKVVSQIVAETPFTKLVKERIKPKRTLKVWEIVFLILGLPLWLSLLIAAFTVLLGLYVSIWSVLVSLWALMASLAVCSLAGIASTAVLALGGSLLTALALFGVALFLAGISIFLFFASKRVTKAFLFLTKKAILCVKSRFLGKEYIK